MEATATNTTAPVIGAQATQPLSVTSIATQQAQASSKSAIEEKASRFKAKAEKQVSKILLDIESLEKLSNKRYYTYSSEQVQELFGAIQAELEKAKDSFTADAPEKKKRFTFSA